MIIYTEDIKKVLENTILNENDLKIIENAINKTTRKRFKKIIPDLYKLLQNGYTTKDLALIYFYSVRTIQIYLKEIGWNLSNEERKMLSYRKARKYILKDKHYQLLYGAARIMNRKEDDIMDELFQMLEDKYSNKGRYK